jgi:hypothetical protein
VNKPYGRLKGPLSLSGMAPNGFRLSVAVEARVGLSEVEGATTTGVTLGPPWTIQSECELGCTFCTAEVSIWTVPVLGSVLSYKNIKSCPWGTEVCHDALLLVDTPSATTFNLKASPPGT